MPPTGNVGIQLDSITMAHGIYTKRDFQIAEVQAWHNLTRLAKPSREHFPVIVPVPLFIGEDCTPCIYGNRKYVIPVAQDDNLPVAPPYCGETVEDSEEKGCEDVTGKFDARGTYSLFTPHEAWDWVAEVLSGTHYNVESIGMLWNRSFWFISVRLDELAEMSVGDGRASRFQFNFSGGLDRSVSPQCELSNIVAVCHNTISLSRASGKVLFAERATKKFKTRLEAAKGEVENAVGMAAVFKAAMDSLAAKPCDRTRAERIFAGRIGEGENKLSTRARNTVATLGELHVRGLGNKGKTEFDMLNAYTQLLTRGGDDSKVSPGRRFASGEFGSNADAKADFMRFLTDEKTDLDAVADHGKTLLALKN